MCNRLDLQNKLEDILQMRHVYYQPPESLKIEYPAIVYSRTGISTNKADDKVYSKSNIYKVTLIDKNPESIYVNDILDLPFCSMKSAYQSENLHHYQFEIYI